LAAEEVAGRYTCELAELAVEVGLVVVAGVEGDLGQGTARLQALDDPVEAD
jgi:hypothetical protein